MSKDAHLNKLAKEKEISRKIVKEVLDFGVTENQKLDILYFICLSLESTSAMKDITASIKKYRSFLKEDSDENDKEEKSKILLN
jgi:hypothetical protein